MYGAENFRKRFLLVVFVGVLAIVTVGCDRTPPGNVTAFQAAVFEGAVQLTWKNPTNSDFTGVKIQRRTDTDVASPSDGTTVYDGNAEVCTDAGVSGGHTYHYKAFAHDGVPNYASGVTVQVTIPSGEGEGEGEGQANPGIQGDFDQAGAFISAVPDTVLDGSQKQQLLDALNAADAQFDADNACDAAAALADLMALVQAMRNGAATGAAEEIYDDIRLLRYEVVALNPTKLNCPGTERIGEEAANEFDEGASGAGNAVNTATFGEPKMLTVHQGDEVFTQVTIPGAESQMGDPGNPAVPVFRQLIGVPDGATASVDVTIEAAEDLKLHLVPVQEQDVDQGSQPPSFAKNEQVYKADQLFPRKWPR